MNIRDFQDSLDYIFEAETTAFVWGHAGIGKTSIVKDYAKKKGYHFFALYLGTQSDVGDVLGLASFRRDAEGNDEATRFATPEWLADAVKYCNENPQSGAIIFLDEFNRGRRDVLNGMFSLALDKKFHTIQLPKNCHIIAAGNPPTDEYYTTDVNETALMARFVHVKLEPTHAEWAAFAKESNVDSTLTSFLSEQPELLEEKRQHFELPVKVDRRCWSKVDRLIKLNTPQHILKQLMLGIIGAERLVAYEQHLSRMEKPLTGKEVLDGQHFDRLRAWATPGDTKASLLVSTCDSVLQEMVELTVDLTDSQGDNLMAFIQLLPKDNAFVFIQNLIEKRSKAFAKFSMNPRYQDALVQTVQIAKGRMPKGIAA